MGKEQELVCEVEGYQLDIVCSPLCPTSGEEQEFFLLWSFSEKKVLGRCGNTHKPPVECLDVGISLGEQKGCLSEVLNCRREISEYCLCLCTKQEFRLLESLDGNLEEVPSGVSDVLGDFSAHVGNDQSSGEE